MLGYNRLDEMIQKAAARNEAAANMSRMQRIRDDIGKRSSGADPDYEGIGGTLAGLMGGDAKQHASAYGSMGGDDRAAYAAAAAEASRPGAVAGAHGLFARDDRYGKIARGGVIGGGVVGSGLGLTAAGQGLVSLMQYLQEGQVTEVKRDQELA